MPRNDTSYALAKRAVRDSRKEQIRKLFKRVGATSTRGLAKLCIDEGIFSDTDVENAALTTFQNVVRDSLSEDDDTGLPFAGQTATFDVDHQRLWKQRALWEYDDYVVNVEEHITQRDAGHVMAVRLADECEQRFHLRIVIPSLP